MKIINLIEDTKGAGVCVPAHGLSFYIETDAHKLLVDLGPSEETLNNAEKLGIDIAGVDTVVLSHGHYDHSGGIMPFVRRNNTAKIYMQRTAVGDFWSDDGETAGGERYRYIGIDGGIAKLPQVVFVDGDCRIDDELELFTVKHANHPIPSANKTLLVKSGGRLMQDSFDHEHYLVIRDGDRRILVSGCAHKGMLNIMEAFAVRYKTAPDMVISGFHLMKKGEYTEEERREIADMAGKLKEYPTEYVTCHCTGIKAYEIMKGVIGEKLKVVHSGDCILSGDERHL